jgi:hypothetical protein
MATPYPFAFALGKKRKQWCGLGIVNEDYVRFLQQRPQLPGAAAIGLLVSLQQNVRNFEPVPLQRIMKTFCALKEVFIPGYDLPGGIDAQFLHEGHQLAQDFGYSSTLASRVDLHDPEALQALGKLAELIDHVLTSHAGIFFQDRCQGASSRNKI